MFMDPTERGNNALNNSKICVFAFFRNKAKTLILEKLFWNNNQVHVVVHGFSFMESGRH